MTDLYLIGISHNIEHDHHEAQRESYNILQRCGATDITWHSSSSNKGSRIQQWRCRCTEEVLCLLAISGVEIFHNISENARITAEKKVNDILDRFTFGTLEITEADIGKIFSKELARRFYRESPSD